MTPNAIIIGSGHYVTGKTELNNKKKTDKDMGVLLLWDSLFEKNQ